MSRKSAATTVPATSPDLATLAASLASLSAQVQALMTPASAPASVPHKAKAKAKSPKVQGTFGAATNYAATGALTRANYDATLAAARDGGHPWADGSNKPIVHILKRGQVAWKGAVERDAAIAKARKAIFA